MNKYQSDNYKFLFEIKKGVKNKLMKIYNYFHFFFFNTFGC